MAARHHTTNEQARRVLAFTDTFVPGYKAGGPIKSMVQILKNLPASVKVTLVTSDRDRGDSAPYEGLSGRFVHRGSHDVYYLNRRNPRHWIALWGWARRNPIDLIYVNSLWNPLFTVLPVVAHRLGLLPAREVLLAPRGELSAGALGIKSIRKRTFLLAWAPFLRGINPVWNVSTEMEQTDIHRLFPGVRTVIQADGGGDEPRAEIIGSKDRARFVFISRITEMKNLLLALQALGAVKTEVDFDIYGPVTEAHYWRQCQALIADLSGNVQVRYLGELRPDQVRDTFAQYDAFILPTRGENFGHVIAESLSSGCPVICSRRTSWTQVLLQGGGVVLDHLDAATLTREIEAWANRPSSQRDRAKRNAMAAYVCWRASHQMTSAVERTLDGLPSASPTECGANLPRVALVTQGYQSAGGVQTVARWLVNGLCHAGYQVDVFDLATSRSDPYSRQLLFPGSWRRSTLLVADPSDVQLTHVGANGVEFEPLRYRPRAELSTELSRYDLVQVVAGAPSLALAVANCRSPIVLQVATTVAWERASSQTTNGPALAIWRRVMTKATSLMERQALRRADTVMVENVQMQEFVRSVSQTPAVVAPPGVDTERFTPRSAGWGPNGYLLSVCRLNDTRKGLDRLIRSYALMTTQRPSVPTLVLAGRGELPMRLTQLIAELGLAECVKVQRDVPHSELPSLYRGASVYLQTSYEEGLGISILEAMASGLPVVSTESAGTLETVAHGSTGWLICQDSDVEGAAARLTLSVLDSGGQQMAVSARSRAVSFFSEQVAISRFLEVYEQLLGVGPRRRE
jgi:glycosyltransferase involved in cell wall biosynthesis